LKAALGGEQDTTGIWTLLATKAGSGAYPEPGKEMQRLVGYIVSRLERPNSEIARELETSTEGFHIFNLIDNLVQRRKWESFELPTEATKEEVKVEPKVEYLDAEGYDLLLLIPLQDYHDYIKGDPKEEKEWEEVTNEAEDEILYRFKPGKALLKPNGERLTEEEYAELYKMSLDVITFAECCYSAKWAEGFDYSPLWEAASADGSIDGDAVDVDRFSQMIKERKYWMGDCGGYVVATNQHIEQKEVDDKSFEDYKKEYYPASTQDKVIDDGSVPDEDTVKLRKLVEDATKFEPLAAGTKCYYKVTDTEDMVNGIYVDEDLVHLRSTLVDDYGSDALYTVEDIELTVDRIIPDNHSNITVVYYDNECETIDDAASATLNTLEDAEIFIDGRCAAWGGHCSVLRVVIKDGDKIENRLPSNTFFPRAFHLDHFEIMLNRVVSSPKYLKVIGCKNTEEAEAKVSEEEFIELIRTGQYPVIEPVVSELSLEIKGSHICITGQLTKTRKEYEEAIEAAGGINAKGVTKTTDILVCNLDHSSKKDRATELGIPIITEDQLGKLLG